MLRLMMILSLFIIFEVTTIEYEATWMKFKIEYVKKYSTLDEENKRYKIFAENLKTFERQNSLYRAGNVSYEMGINKFADMTDGEYAKFFTSTVSVLRSRRSAIQNIYRPPDGVELPDSVDWREKDVVRKIKNQQEDLCGSCYAFAAVGCLESLHFLKTGTFVDLSEQNIIDCSRQHGNDGCEGGWTDQAYDYIRDYGIMREDDYPYIARTGICKFNSTQSLMKIKGRMRVADDDIALQAAITNIGPIAVAVDAREWKSYKGGIFVGEEEFTDLNHAAVVVGYGAQDGQKYWIIKNSYGAKFGEGGYIRIARDVENQCGITKFAVFPVI